MPTSPSSIPDFVYLKDQEPLSDHEFEIATGICAWNSHLIQNRQKYIQEAGLSAETYMPQSNWSLDHPGLYDGTRLVASGQRSIVEYLRLFTIITGFDLLNMCPGDAELSVSLAKPIPASSLGEEGALADSEFPFGPIGALDQHLQTVALTRFGQWWVNRFEAALELLPAFLHIVLPRKFGEIGWLINGHLVNCDIYAYFERLALLYEAGILNPLSANSLLDKEPVILEIGGGFGGLAYLLKKLLPGAQYYIVDLPETLLLSAIYLSILFQKQTNVLPKIEADSTSFQLAAPGTAFIPNFLMPRFRQTDIKFDLVINTLSMSEMSESQVRDYCLSVREMLKPDGVFFEQNHDGRHLNLLKASDIVQEYFPVKQTLTGQYCNGTTQGIAHLWRVNDIA